MASTQLAATHLFSMTVDLGDRSHALIKGGPTGTRMIVPVVSGTFEGERLKGTVVGPGGDWVHARADGSIHLDVRVQLVTEDGEAILMTYNGIGVPQEDRSTKIRSAPRFETGAESYAWLNNVQAVGIGEAGRDSVTYEVYSLD